MADIASKTDPAILIPKDKWYSHLYFQVIIAITIGALLGHFYP